MQDGSKSSGSDDEDGGGDGETEDIIQELDVNDLANINIVDNNEDLVDKISM